MKHEHIFHEYYIGWNSDYNTEIYPNTIEQFTCLKCKEVIC